MFTSGERAAGRATGRATGRPAGALAAAPRPTPPVPLQRQLGNQRVQRIGLADGRRVQRACACGGGAHRPADEEGEPRVQTRSTVGPPGDRYEQEAERVAENVVRTPGPGPEPPRIRLLSGDASGAIGGPQSLPMDGGRPLSPGTRDFMERRFGSDFSGVRLHTGAEAEHAAARLRARAFTYGPDVWLGRGESEANHRLLAHELTHVVQQGAAGPRVADAAPRPTGSSARPRVQRARLPCSSSRTIDVYTVSLPGSSRTPATDVGNANAILCQCGIELNEVGGQSWATNLMDTDAPVGVLNESTSSITAEVQAMTDHRPGGDVIHAYFVPSNSLGDRGGSYGYATMFPGLNPSVSITDIGEVDTLAHEFGHLLMADASHHGNADNLMASGRIRNVGVDELEESQCSRM